MTRSVQGWCVGAALMLLVLLAAAPLALLAASPAWAVTPRAATTTTTSRVNVPRHHVASTSDWSQVSAAELPENASVTQVDGTTWIGAHDLARLLGATKFWRADLRKLELRAGGHRLMLTVDNPFVLIDDRTVALTAPVRSRAGELRAPVALIDSLPRDTTLARLVYDVHRGLVLRVPPEGLVGSPAITADSTSGRVVFPVERPEDVAVIGRDRSHFRIRFGGFFVGALPDTPSPSGIVRSLRPIASAEGSAFELNVAPNATGFRIDSDADRQRLVLEISTDKRATLEPFAPEGVSGPRPIRVIVVDPGHGGADAGVVVRGATEKNLTLALARALEGELERRTNARVVLTRTDDRAVSIQERAERANRARADIVLSLHFDGAPSAAAHGVTAICPPATYGGSSEVAETGPPALVLVPWRDVAVRHAVRSRQLTEAILSALELRGLGPARVREIVPYALLGVNAPGIVLECGMLTSDADRQRITGPQGISNLAQAIAAGIDAYARAQ